MCGGKGPFIRAIIWGKLKKGSKVNCKDGKSYLGYKFQ